MTSVKIGTRLSKGQIKKSIISHFYCKENNKKLYAHFKEHHKEFTMGEELPRELHHPHDMNHMEAFNNLTTLG
jgi:hypothetical protein